MEMLTRGRTILVLAISSTLAMSGDAHPAAAETVPTGFEDWAFLLGEWQVVEQRYGFDGELIQTNAGSATFSLAMNGQRIQELQSIPRGDEEMTALQVFVYDPRRDEIQIARTDSGHYGFSVIVGTISGSRIDLLEKNPNPESDVTRRFTYRRIDSDHFERQLEFSTDEGASWFVRSEWIYSRK